MLNAGTTVGVVHGVAAGHRVLPLTLPGPEATDAPRAAIGHPFVAELARIDDVEYADLPTGHWPQFTGPAELGAATLAAVDR